MPPRRKRKKRSKVVVLDSRIWVKSSEIPTYRKMKLLQQKGKCAITGVKIPDNSPVDHTHYRPPDRDMSPYGEDGRCRGVIAKEVNLIEGRFLKLFQKSKIEEKYGICFEDFLINLGKYLKQDNSQEKFHYSYMNDFRKVVKRWGKDKLLRKLKEDFKLEPSKDTLVSELVQLYVQQWVYTVEEMY